MAKPKSQPALTTDAPPEQTRSMGTFMISVIVHAVLLALALIWVAQRILLAPEETAFTPPTKRVQLPAQIREQKMSLAKHDAMAPRPSYSARVSSAQSAPQAVVVPPMPEVNLSKMLPLDPSELVSDQVSGMIGSAGYGRGTGSGIGGGGGAGGSSGMAFFDIKDAAKSVVIMIDVSQSMFSRTGDYDSSSRKKLKTGKDQAFQVIRDEAIKLIDGLGVNTRFGIIRWSGSARSWKPELVRATDGNKEEARQHILADIDANSSPPTGGRPGGTRHDYALEELFKLAPETAFMLTDGNATESLSGGGMTAIPEKRLTDQITDAAREMETMPRIHTIYYMTGTDKKEEEDLLRAIARKTKGKFRKVEAAKAPDKKDERKRR